MRAFLVEEPGVYGVEELPAPEPGPGEVLVEVVAAGICGSDRELVEGRRPSQYVSYPVVPGHEWAGRVARLGPGVSGLQPGDPVVAEGLRTCGVCARCAEGRTNLCTAAYAETGFTHPGAMAESVLVPAPLIHRLPADRPVEPAALIEPAACVAGGLLETGMPRAGSKLAVIGDGALGLLSVLFLRLTNPAELVLVGRRPARSARALDLGATGVVNARDADAVGALDGSFDTVVEASNSPEGGAVALRLPRRGGTAILLGISGAERTTIDPDTISLGQLRVQGIFAASRAAWRWTVELYAQGLFDPAPLITHRFRLDDVTSALDTLAVPGADVVKVLVHPDGGGAPAG
ncbi:MAG TPA: alcohol dehydrogenase catalytic domain-containing protein [Actinomycetes bacterium]